MVSLWRALKIALFYFIPLAIFFLLMNVGLASFNIKFQEGALVLVGQGADLGIGIGIFVVSFLLFVTFLLKSIGDIAEEALTYYE
ncbi:MAG: hypothetical protein ACTSYD_05700 [Candidatus Heimdallarchaeaceae archaeon]